MKFTVADPFDPFDLLIERRRAFVPKTTKFDPSLPVSLNLVKDIVVDSPNQVHVSDITYIKVGSNYAYLSLVTDRFCRDVIGWHLSGSLKSSGPIAALKMAARANPALARSKALRAFESAKKASQRSAARRAAARKAA